MKTALRVTVSDKTGTTYEVLVDASTLGVLSVHEVQVDQNKTLYFPYSWEKLSYDVRRLVAVELRKALVNETTSKTNRVSNPVRS